jgi:hypothetical protein
MKAPFYSLLCGFLLIGGADSDCKAAEPQRVGPHTIIKVYLDSGNPGTPLSVGYNSVAKTKINCPKDNLSCTVALSVMDQLCAQYNGDQFYIIVTVDGTQVDAGEGATNSAPCGGGNWSDSYSVAPGPHTIELFTDFIGNGSATQGQWSAHYEITVP